MNLDEDFTKVVIFLETKCTAGANEEPTLQGLNNLVKIDINLTEVNRSKLNAKKESYLQWATLEETVFSDLTVMR